MEAPTIGTKLLIANLAVFNETVSAPCVSIFLNEEINIKSDIIKTVTDVNVFLTSLDNPPNSTPPIDFTQLNIIQIFINGSMQAIRKPSVMEISKIIVAFVIVAVEILPLIISIDVIIGAKELIT